MTEALESRCETPRLSILVPFYRDNPAALVRALDAQCGPNAAMEIVICDDGSADASLTADLTALVADMATPLRLVTKPVNEGRAAARNTLAAAARGDWLLFLDADMTLPVGFIASWLDVIETSGFDAAFGGFAAEPPEHADGRLHAAMAHTGDTGDARARALRGATAFCTSNLLVRSGLARAVPFDDGFRGWGWEDVDWAVRAAKTGSLIHVDNPAGHRGWQPVEQLLSRYREAAANYARLLEKNPELASLPGARAARTLRHLPGQAALRGVWSALARSEGTPMRVRTLALKLWRASWAAEALTR